jgi:succinoglycan biosynthesis transport protein ExoP
MLNVKNAMISDLDSASSARESASLDLGRLWAAIKRRRRLVAGWTGAFLALAIVYLLLATPTFLATAQIIIDAESDAIMHKGDAPDAETIDTSLVDSQVEIIASDAIARSVIRSLNLSSDPEFVGPSSSAIGRLIGWFTDGVAGMQSAFGIDQGPPPDAESRAVEVFDRNLTVRRTGLTYVITIGFSSQDPAKSERIANAVADAYLDSVLNAKYEATKRAGTWLENRLSDIRAQATEADRAVEVFKAANNIVDTNRGLMNQQQLSELNTQYSIARAATAEAKAKLDRAEDIRKNALGVSTVSDAINDPVISRLRAQYLDLAAKESDLSTRLGPNHYSTIALRNHMQEIRKSVQDELNRISDGYQSDYRIAQERELAIGKSLRGLVTDSDASGLAQVKLKDLQSSADSTRALYNDFLQRYQVATQRQSFPIADARIVTKATEPLRKNSPKTLLVLAGGLVFGLMAGVGAAIAGDMLSDTFATPQDVEAFTGAPCLGVLPLIKSARTATLFRRSGGATKMPISRNAPETYVLDAPFSRFAETIRNVKVSIDALRTPGSDPCRIVGVTSSVPGEGKSTTAANIAQLVALTGKRTLLIDCDLSTRTLTYRLAPNANVGLLQALANMAPLSALAIVDPRSRMEFLPCVSPGRILSRADLMASPSMSDLLAAARKSYDYVIVDLAPIVPVVDARAVAEFIDGFLMVIEWRATSRKVVAEALSVEGIRERVIGVALSKADTEQLKHLEEYRGRGFGAYYTEG